MDDPGAKIEKHRKEVELIHRRHQIYSGLVGKDIELRYANPPGHTDCNSFIAIPIEDPDAGLIHQHEWQHILTGSDLVLRKFFVESYIIQLKSSGMHRFQVGPVPLSTSLSDHELSTFIHYFINALDDLRACSLWEDPYPQSAEDIRARWKRLIVTSGAAKTDITMYLLGLGLGCISVGQAGSYRWKKYDIVLERAAKAVRKKSFANCLAVAKEVLDQIFSEYSEYVHDLVHSVINKAMDTSIIPFSQSKEEDQRFVRSMVRHGVKADELHYLETKDRDILAFVDSLRAPKKTLSRDEKLLMGFEGQVSFVDVAAEDVDVLKLNVEDLQTTRILRQKFMTLLQRKRTKKTEYGSELNPGDYVDFLMGGDEDFLRDETSVRGFSSLILLDMSGSMVALWNEVSRACKVLAKSMKFPFSKFEVWGFSSSRDTVHLFRFEDVERGYSGKGVKNAWGMTPLHIATAVAVRHLKNRPEAVHHLWILSDGEPVHISPRFERLLGSKELLNQVASSIQAGRKANVRSYGVVLGNRVGDATADLLYGERSWGRVDLTTESLFHTLVNLVGSAFSNYLKVNS